MWDWRLGKENKQKYVRCVTLERLVSPERNRCKLESKYLQKDYLVIIIRSFQKSAASFCSTDFTKTRKAVLKISAVIVIKQSHVAISAY